MSDELERARRVADKYLPRVALIEPTEEDLAEALMENQGNVSEAAERLAVESAWLRREIMKSKRLEAVMTEVMERHVDKAVGIIRQGMDEESYLVKFYAAKEFLRTETGRRRGFGMPHQAQVVEGGGSGGRAIIVLKWLDDSVAEPKQIEGTLKEE